MRIIISNNSPIPIYEQIKNTIIEQILNNELKENELLPSIRNLAADIKISVMTIKKAYDELANEGYIFYIQGKGTFVASKNKELVLENAKKEIEDKFLQIIDISKQFNINKNEIENLFDILYEGEEK